MFLQLHIFGMDFRFLAISNLPRAHKDETEFSLCSWAGRFESYLVANPEDRFFRDGAHHYALW